MQFYADVSGNVTGIRFYKGAGNTGAHVGNLWAADGTLLATATFSNETTAGWQQVAFASPVAIQANTTYVASYFAPNGAYAADAGYFTSAGVDAYPLHAPSSPASGGNGGYAYGPGSSFPNLSWGDTNYWVDLVFRTAPVVTAVTPASGATGVSRTTAVTAVFDRAMDPTTINGSTVLLKDAGGNVVSATVTYNAGTNTVTLTPLAPLNPFTSYTAFLRGGSTGSRVRDLYGNDLAADYTWSFTTGS